MEQVLNTISWWNHYWARDIITIEQIITFTEPIASLFLLNIPKGAIILAVQVNLETVITGNGGATKIGIGTRDVSNKYGETIGLAKNHKIDKILEWAVLSEIETLQLIAMNPSNWFMGEVGVLGEIIKIQIMYKELISLPDAL